MRKTQTPSQPGLQIDYLSMAAQQHVHSLESQANRQCALSSNGKPLFHRRPNVPLVSPCRCAGSPRAVAVRPCHILWRKRRLRHNGRRVRVRESVQPGVRHEHGGAEHVAVQQRAELRLLLRAPVLWRTPLVPPGRHHHGDGHQLLPSQLRAPQQRWRVVQPAAPALRPRGAGVPPHRPVPRRHRAGVVPQGALREERRGPVRGERARLLQPGAGDQRGRRRRRARGVGEGVVAPRPVAAHVAQLGPELAEQRQPQRPGALLPRHHQRRPGARLPQRGAEGMAVRPDLPGPPVLRSGMARFR